MTETELKGQYLRKLNVLHADLQDAWKAGRDWQNHENGRSVYGLDKIVSMMTITAGIRESVGKK